MCHSAQVRYYPDGLRCSVAWHDTIFKHLVSCLDQGLDTVALHGTARSSCLIVLYLIVLCGIVLVPYSVTVLLPLENYTRTTLAALGLAGWDGAVP